jgi:hypothetical protein
MSQLNENWSLLTSPGKSLAINLGANLNTLGVTLLERPLQHGTLNIFWLQWPIDRKTRYRIRLLQCSTFLLLTVSTKFSARDIM